MVNKWYLAGKVHSSTYRTQILNKLKDSVKTPTLLQKETNIGISHVSRSLKELSDMKLVKCLNPKMRRSKIYTITELGKEILDHIKKL